jgi:hypothetical protein
MREDDRMREFVRRIVAMSPEPADFLEESPMPAPPRRSGAWVVAVAGLAAAALVVPMLFGSAPPTAGDPGTTIASPSTTEPPPGGQDVTVFLTQGPGNSPTGNPALIAVSWFDGPIPSAQGYGSGSWLLGHLALQPHLIPEGFTSVVPAGVSVLDERVESIGGRQVVVLDMSPQFLAGAGGLLADITMLNQFIYTATDQRPGMAVLFLVDGEAIETYGMEGMSLTDPVDRDTFLEYLNPVLVTGIHWNDDESLTIEGRANVFEANISYRMIFDSAIYGPGFQDSFVTASCGSGCWGEFEIRLEVGQAARTSAIEVSGSSGEDGTPTHLIRLALPPR